MKLFRVKYFYIAALCLGRCAAQDAAAPLAQDDSSLPDSPSFSAHRTVHELPPGQDREATWRTVPGDFLHDQKHLWLFPTKLARGHDWVPTLAVAAATIGLIYADPHIMTHLRAPSQGLDNFNDVFDPMITTSEVIALPAGLMAAGYVRHDPYQVSTALLAAEAYGDSAIVDLAMKAVTRRERPSDVPVGALNDTFFNAGKSPFKGSSFPSGHATAAFSVAAVVATRYRNHRWVPWAVYGMATAIGISRITSSAHFPSDVFAGAALGYTVTRFQVLRPR